MHAGRPVAHADGVNDENVKTEMHEMLCLPHDASQNVEAGERLCGKASGRVRPAGPQGTSGRQRDRLSLRPHRTRGKAHGKPLQAPGADPVCSDKSSKTAI